MNSLFSTAKNRTKRPMMRVLATVLSVVILITSLGFGSILSVDAIDINGADTIYVHFENNANGSVNGGTTSAGYNVYFSKDGGDPHQWHADCYVKTNTDSTFTYDVKWVFKFSANGSEEWRSNNNTFTLTAGDWKNYSDSYVPTGGYTDKLVIPSDTNKYNRLWLNMKSWGSGNNIGFVMNSYPIDPLSASYTSSPANSKTVGEIISVIPETKSGGSGDYNYSYAVTKDGVSVNASDYVDNGQFQTMQTGTYVVTTTMKDNKCPDLTAATASKTINVTTSKNWHIYGLKNYGATTLNESNRMISNGDGTFYLDVNLEHYTSGDDGTTNGKFAVKNEDGVVFGPDASGDYVIKEKYLSKPISMKPNSGYFFKFTVDNTACQWTRSCRITLDTNNRTLSVTPTDIVVIAKDGASRSTTNSASTKWNYGVIADTTIEAANGETRASWTKETDYKTCDIETSNVNGVNKKATFETIKTTVGTTISIKTTVDSSYKNKYKVKAFNINGKGVLPSTSNESTGVYTLDNYTIKSSVTAPFLEITPVYYLTDTYKSTNAIETVTYYMEGFDSTIQTKWGDTIYAYPFYGTLGDTNNTFGAYPGQPFINIDGKYGIEIPVNKNVPVGTDAPGSTVIKGVTVNCGSLDYVHDLINDYNNIDYQTYDSDGFYKIYHEKLEVNPKTGVAEKPNSIIQSFKFKSTTNNRNTYGGQENDIWGYKVNDDVVTTYTASTPKTTDQWINEVSNGNGWELYTDRFGRPIDIFGNHITPVGASSYLTSYDPAYESSTPALRVISSGYIANISGDYGTGWMVYKPNRAGTEYTLEYDSKNKIYSIPPTIFILSDSSSFSNAAYTANDVTDREAEKFTYSDAIGDYSAMYTDLKENYDNRYVYVSYEKNAQIYANTGAYRMDTKWEYTYSFDTAHADIQIEYSADGLDYSTDTLVSGYNGYNNLGSTSGCYAYFTNSNTVGTVTNVEGNITSTQTAGSSSTYNFTAVPGTGKMLEGWYLKNGDNYTPIDTDGKSFGSIPVTGNEVIVARFKPVSDGSLTISHNPTANNEAFGSTKVQVTVYNGPTELYDSGSSGSSVTLDSSYISNTHSTYTINVTLLTVATAENTSFDSSTGYVYDSFNGTNEITATPSTNSTTFSFSVEKLYNEGLISQTTNSLIYTSTFTVLPTYTYNYTDREGGSQVCVAVGTVPLSETEKENGYPNTTDRDAEITSVLTGLGISSYKKDTSVTATTTSSGSFNVDATVGFSNTGLSLTYFYPLTAGDTPVSASITLPNGDSKTVYRASNYQSGSVSGAYGALVNLYNIVHGSTLSGYKFYAWCEYTPGANDAFGTIGDIVSTEENFNYAVAKDQKIIAVYCESDYSEDVSAPDRWDSYVDDNKVTLSKRTAETDGTYYNDSLVRFTNYKTNSSVTELTNDSVTVEYGILIVYRTAADIDGSGGLLEISAIKENTKFLNSCVSNLTSYQTGRNNTQKVNATKIVIDNNYLSNLNRADVVLKSSYSKFNGAQYAVVAYLREGNGTIHYSSTDTKNY